MADNISTGEILTPSHVALILQLRLLIARAAGSDSLRWWEDESFSTDGRFILDRLFPFAPPLISRSLAILAAVRRHTNAMAPHSRYLHLYRLDNDGLDRLALSKEPLLPIPVPAEPITTLAQLRHHLLTLLGDEPAFTAHKLPESPLVRLELSACPPDMPLLVQRARALASAYLHAQPAHPVFPYIVE